MSVPLNSDPVHGLKCPSVLPIAFGLRDSFHTLADTVFNYVWQWRANMIRKSKQCAFRTNGAYIPSFMTYSTATELTSNIDEIAGAIGFLFVFKSRKLFVSFRMMQKLRLTIASMRIEYNGKQFSFLFFIFPSPKCIQANISSLETKSINAEI